MGMRLLFRKLFPRKKKDEAVGSLRCTLCKNPLPVSDLEKGLAIIIARRNICRVCVTKVTTRRTTSPGLVIEAASSAIEPL